MVEQESSDPSTGLMSQKSGMDYTFFCTGLLGKSAITSNKNPLDLLNTI
jgi:hypothetical protein